jgi:hypothetical protein
MPPHILVSAHVRGHFRSMMEAREAGRATTVTFAWKHAVNHTNPSAVWDMLGLMRGDDRAGTTG